MSRYILGPGKLQDPDPGRLSLLLDTFDSYAFFLFIEIPSGCKHGISCENVGFNRT